MGTNAHCLTASLKQYILANKYNITYSICHKIFINKQENLKWLTKPSSEYDTTKQTIGTSQEIHHEFSLLIKVNWAEH